MTKILLVEDDDRIIETLKLLLEGEGYTVSTAMSQEEAIATLKKKNVDLVLLDIGLPDGDGFQVCAAVRGDVALARNKDVPIIFLTAYDDEASVVKGLELGAEDYVTKPFRPHELLSRIKSVMRRTGRDSSVIKVGNLTVDTLRGTVRKGKEELFLSVLEHRLLLVFLNHRGEVLTRDKLIEEIWDIAGEYVNDNTLTVYIKRLREKIEKNPKRPAIIKTVRGKGYMVDDGPAHGGGR